MNICHVITRMIVGGAQENTLYTIVGHIEKGHSVTLLTGPSPGPEGELLKNSDFPDFEIVEVPGLCRELNPIKDYKAWKFMRDFFKERKFDVVHTHSSKAGVIGRAAAWSAKVPFVCHTVHGQAFHPYETGWRNSLYKASERWAAKRSHKIYAVAQAMIDQCVEAKVAPREKYKVVYSGMDIDLFMSAKREPELRKELGIPENARVIGAVARLFPLKGYEYFIPAAAAIAAKYPDAHFLIVGNGPMREAMDKDLAERGLTDKFSFSGLVPPTQVCRYIAQMDILMHLSLREGLPRSLVQALACAKPAISFELDGAPEVIHPGETGYLARPENTDDVIRSIDKLMADPDLAERLGQNGRELVKDRFPWRTMADILEQEYLENLKELGYPQ
jgi:glycosyltransferase involved in cell wall biosynthesis